MALSLVEGASFGRLGSVGGREGHAEDLLTLTESQASITSLGSLSKNQSDFGIWIWLHLARAKSQPGSAARRSRVAPGLGLVVAFGLGCRHLPGLGKKSANQSWGWLQTESC